MKKYFENERKTAMVFYNQFDMGNKYKVYSFREGIKKFEISFSSIIDATNYCKKIL